MVDSTQDRNRWWRWGFINGDDGGGKGLLPRDGGETPSFHPNTVTVTDSIGIDTGPLDGAVAADDLMALIFATS